MTKTCLGLKWREYDQTTYSWQRRLATVVLVCIATSLTGCAIMAADPMQEMMKLAGAYSDKEPKQRDYAAASITEFGIAATGLLGVLVSPIIKNLGIRFTVILGLLLHSLGYFCLIYLKSREFHYIGAACFGCTFQALINSSINIATLYPRMSQLLISIMSSMYDMSYFVPFILLKISSPSTIRIVVAIYLVLALVIGISVSMGLLPDAQFRVEPLDQKLHNSSQKNLISSEVTSGSENCCAYLGNESLSKRASDLSQSTCDFQAVSDFKTKESTLIRPKYADCSIRKQLLSLEYSLIFLVSLLSFMRKKNFLVFIRLTLREISGADDIYFADRYTDVFNVLIPYGFVSSIILGFCSGRIGPHLNVIAVNAMALIVNFLYMMPSIHLQLVSILMIIIVQSYTYTGLICQLADFFGFDNLPCLQGVAYFFTGILCILFDITIASHIQRVSDSPNRVLNYIFTGIALFMFIPLLYLHMQSRKHQREVQAYAKINDTQFSREA